MEISYRWSYRCVASGALAVSALLLAGCQQATPPAIPNTQVMAIDTPPPVYPPELACNDIGGKVLLQVAVAADGRPSEIRTLEGSGQPALDAAAREAVEHWKFEPATRLNLPIASRINVPVTFTPPPIKPEECLVLQERRTTTP